MVMPRGADAGSPALEDATKCLQQRTHAKKEHGTVEVLHEQAVWQYKLDVRSLHSSRWELSC